jgi:hypothetical protein
VSNFPFAAGVILQPAINNFVTTKPCVASNSQNGRAGLRLGNLASRPGRRNRFPVWLENSLLDFRLADSRLRGHPIEVNADFWNGEAFCPDRT